MNTLFINPPNVPFTSKGLMIEPIDVLTVASFAQNEGYRVSVVDMDGSRMTNDGFRRYLQGVEAPEVVVIMIDYHIPLYTDSALENVIQIARIAKENGSRVIIGGKVATYQPERLLFPSSPVDATCGYEMELTLKELFGLPSWSNGELGQIAGICYFDAVENKIVKTALRKETVDLATFLPPDRSLLAVDERYIDVRTMLSSRGCPHKCSFCHVPNYWGRWRWRPSESVVDEIEGIVKTFGSKKILFLDDNTIVHPLRMKEISDGIIERGIKVTLGCLGSLSVYQEEIAKKMYGAGFRWFHFGVETGDAETLKRIRKGVTQEKMRSSLASAKAIGYRIRTSWILDLPDMTLEELDRTIAFILEAESEEIRLHFLALRLGSEWHIRFQHLLENKHDVPQYIHRAGPQIETTAVSSEVIEERVNGLLLALSAKGYRLVTDPDDFAEYDRNPEAFRKVVSLCPMRYGLCWDL